MTPDERFRRFQDLQRYVGWTDADVQNVQAVSSVLDPYLEGLVEDFYAEIERHPAARRVVTGGIEQVRRLKSSLLAWLRELLSGPYDEGYVERRWRVGQRHVEIGLDQIYTNVALSRLRGGMIGALGAEWTGDRDGLVATIRSLMKLFDLDLAKIEDAYQAEYIARQERIARLVTVGKIGSSVAHELRNPLNNIRTSAYYLIHASNATPDKRSEHLKRIEAQVHAADRVITTLSNYAKMPVPDLKPVDLRRVAEQSVAEIVLPASIRVAYGWPETMPKASADADQLRIVVSNIIRNAVDAMPAGGTLTFDGRAGIDFVELAVSDTGVGIPPDQLARITEPLFTTKAKGLGLGLALARDMLEKNHGKLSVTSRPGEGTTFTVRLTLAL